MLIATDPFSLLFIGCFLFGLLFLLVTALMGSLAHGHGLGHDVGHATGHDIGHGHAVSHDIGGHTNGSHGVADSNRGMHIAHIHVATQSAAHGTRGLGARGVTGDSFSLFAILNPTSIVLFLLGFGFFGYVFHNSTALALPFTLVLAGVSGFIIAGLLLMMINRLFGDSEGATVQDVSDRTGLLGKVSITIQENNIGEIIYVSPGGMRKSIPARSVDGRRLERDQEVIVVNYQHGIAEVDTWEHFINQDESRAIEAPDADELATLRALLDQPNKTDTEYVMRKDLPKE
jgi:hypothetical protein